MNADAKALNVNDTCTVCVHLPSDTILSFKPPDAEMGLMVAMPLDTAIVLRDALEREIANGKAGLQAYATMMRMN